MKSNLIVRSEVTSFRDRFLGCGVDKLVLKLNNSISLKKIRPILRQREFEISEFRSKEHKTNLLFKRGRVEIFCFGYLRSEIDWEITSVALKPNLYDDESQLYAVLYSIFGDEIQEAIIRRVDINFDFNLSFIDVLKGIDIKQKHKLFEYLSYSGQLRSVRHGDDNCIKIYDRAKKLRIEDQLTRIEFVFNLYKFHIRYKDYQDALIQISEMSLFDNVEFLEPNVPFSLGFDLYDKTFKKFIQFFCLYEQYGFTQAKKILNSHDNFLRDYKKIIQCKVSPFNLRKILTESHLFVPGGPWTLK